MAYKLDGTHAAVSDAISRLHIHAGWRTKYLEEIRTRALDELAVDPLAPCPGPLVGNWWDWWLELGSSDKYAIVMHYFDTADSLLTFLTAVDESRAH